VAILLAVLCALALAAVGASLFALLYAKALVSAANQRTSELQNQLESALETTQTRLEELRTEVRTELRELPQQSPVTVTPTMPRPGLNLTTRSQVLRSHRRGESAAQIAKVLQVPLQEVELLLKVHRIVLNSMEIHDRRSGHPQTSLPAEPQTAF
jgi:DNA-binding NarL/FixJ family response regulator